MVPSMANTHIIVGTGDEVSPTKSVVHDSLSDVYVEGDTFVIPWLGGRPTPALEMVYDYIVDREISFLMIHDGGSNIPKVFTDAKFGVVQNVASMGEGYADNFDGGTAFVLGEDDITDDWLGDYLDHAIESPQFIDLANGGIPVDLSVEDDGEDEPEAEDEPEEKWVQVEGATKQAHDDEFAMADKIKDEDPTDDAEYSTPEESVDIFSFKREELTKGMPLRVLKNIAARSLEGDIPNSAEGIWEMVEAQRPATPLVDEDPDSLHADIAASFAELLGLLRDAAPCRTMSLAITNVEQAALWYHYGEDLEGGR